MTVHPQVSEPPSFSMPHYMAHSPPGSHHPSSPKAEVPPPIDPYLGHFTVSGANDPDVPPHQSFPNYEYNPVSLDPDLFGRQQEEQQRQRLTHVPVSGPAHLHSRMPSNVPPVHMLGPPQQPPYGSEPTPRIENLRGDPSMLLGPYPPHGARRATQRKKSSPVRKPSRTPKGTPQMSSLEGQSGFEDDNDREELTLRDDAPEDDKYLFQLRKEFISEKGKGMWEEMKAKYSEKHQGNWEKAALQMKVSRAVAKFGVWPKREVSSVRAWPRRIFCLQ
jgi:hypothetical protein